MLIVGASLGFLLSFLVLRHVYPSGILFYQGVALAILVSVVQLGVARFLRRTSWSAALKDVMLTFLLAYSFLFTVPTTVDRSYTVQMLQHLARADGGLSRDELSRFYVAEFVRHGGVDRRLKEQEATGTLVERDGKYVLTSEGETLATTFRYTCLLFACQHSLK